MEQYARQFRNPTTSFFREMNVLTTSVALAEQLPDKATIASIGCSTGEELYSLAALLGERPNRLIGIDVNDYRINCATTGSYQFDPNTILAYQQKLTTKYLAPNCKSETSWQVDISDQLKKMSTFFSQNLVREPLAPTVSMIICANVYIHYGAINQQERLQALHFLRNLHLSLEPNGYLITEEHSYKFMKKDLNPNLWIEKPELAQQFTRLPEGRRIAEAIVLQKTSFAGLD